MPAIELAGGIIMNDTGEFLLLHRCQEHLSQWELPGGKLEPGESGAKATIRELNEELGIIVSIESELGRQAFSQLDREWVYQWFKVKINEGTPSIREPETFDNMRYWSVDALQETDETLSPNVLNLLNSNQLDIKH